MGMPRKPFGPTRFPHTHCGLLCATAVAHMSRCPPPITSLSDSDDAGTGQKATPGAQQPGKGILATAMPNPDAPVAKAKSMAKGKGQAKAKAKAKLKAKAKATAKAHVVDDEEEDEAEGGGG